MELRINRVRINPVPDLNMIPHASLKIRTICYRPPTKLREGNVFTGICLSFCSDCTVGLLECFLVLLNFNFNTLLTGTSGLVNTDRILLIPLVKSLKINPEVFLLTTNRTLSVKALSS